MIKDMDVNYKLGLTAKEFNQIQSAAESVGVCYSGVAGGKSNPHHKFVHPGHRTPWIFVIDSIWKKSGHVRFQHSYKDKLQAFGIEPTQENDSGRNVSIPYDESFEAALAYCCDSGPSDREREMQQRIAKDWARLFGGEYELKHQWLKVSAGIIPDLIALFRPTQSLVVIELKVVHTGREVLAQLQRYLTNPKILSASGDQPPLGAVIAPSYQPALLLDRPGVRLYQLFVEPLGVRLIHDGWGQR
jgi:hypothetical protein